MDFKELKQLILYIVYKVDDLGGYTTTIRLVKFLYLIDLEHYRRYGETLTSLRWVYHHYGPYAFELPEIGRKIGFDLEQESFRTAERQRGTLYRVQGRKNLPNSLRPPVKSMVDGILQVWADYGTKELLKYTYDTEPIVHGARGNELSFSEIPQGTRYYELYIPVKKNRVNKIKDALRKFDRDEDEQYVSPKIKARDISQEVLKSLGESIVPVCPGIKPQISDVSDLLNTLPQEE
jgi:hypothetical protein